MCMNNTVTSNTQVFFEQKQIQGQICNLRYVVDSAMKESDAEDPMKHISHEVWIHKKNSPNFNQLKAVVLSLYY